MSRVEASPSILIVETFDLCFLILRSATRFRFCISSERSVAFPEIRSQNSKSFAVQPELAVRFSVIRPSLSRNRCAVCTSLWFHRLQMTGTSVNTSNSRSKSPVQMHFGQTIAQELETSWAASGPDTLCKQVLHFVAVLTIERRGNCLFYNGTWVEVFSVPAFLALQRAQDKSPGQWVLLKLRGTNS